MKKLIFILLLTTLISLGFNLQQYRRIERLTDGIYDLSIRQLGDSAYVIHPERDTLERAIERLSTAATVKRYIPSNLTGGKTASIHWFDYDVFLKTLFDIHSRKDNMTEADIEYLKTQSEVLEEIQKLAGGVGFEYDQFPHEENEVLLRELLTNASEFGRKHGIR